MGKKVRYDIIFTAEDWGEIILFLLIVAVNQFGDYIEENPKHYSCPSYCEVNHKHISMVRKEIDNNEYTELDSAILVQSRD